jgi:hypothetical protein
MRARERDRKMDEKVLTVKLVTGKNKRQDAKKREGRI